MRKLWLIIKREYLTRVKRKMFILTTLLTPLAIGLFVLVTSYILSYQGDELKIAIIDDFGLLEKKMIKDDNTAHFSKINAEVEVFKNTYEEKGYDGFLHIPKFKNLQQPNNITYYSEKELGINTRSFLGQELADRLREAKIREAGYDEEVLEKIDTKSVNILTKSPSDKEDKDKTMGGIIGSFLGIIMGMIMYMTVFIYGMMVMRSVMEEKTNRIVEVMISSVKPFQLMMGKIIGVGAVGLTQVTIWAIILPIIMFFVQLIVGPQEATQMSEFADAANQIDPEEATAMITQAMNELSAMNWWYILPLFLFYFLGGYFIYASLFAAIGSAMGDDMGESQSLTIPITIPVLIAFYIMIVVAQNPNSDLATWSSIFPLFSPIVMPARLSFEIPLWELLASMASLVACVVFFIWLSAKIYRVGILMYGKKITMKEMWRWIRT